MRGSGICVRTAKQRGVQCLEREGVEEEPKGNKLACTPRHYCHKLILTVRVYRGVSKRVPEKPSILIPAKSQKWPVVIWQDQAHC